jgi:hypothetical protein
MMPNAARLGRRFGPIGVVAALALLASSCVFGPITGPGTSTLPPGFDLSQVGYQRAEYFLGGVAFSYAPTAPLGTDGKWQVAPVPHSEASYETRLFVDRPTDPSKFNGTVIVEWLNVSAGTDVATDLLMAHNEFYRRGAVYVGVSAQFVGVDAAKRAAPDRYAPLHHPGDSYSYDIFSQAGRDIRANASNILGGLVPQRLIAAGESQSAGRLVTYINAIHPLAHVYDGFMVHSRFGGGSSLSQTPQASISVPSPAPIRDDLNEPVMVVEAEGDVIQSGLAARQPDTPKFREWEIAGASHADGYTVAVGNTDPGDGRGAVKMLAQLQNPINAGCGLPINAGGHHWVLQAAFFQLDRWVRTGTPPPSGPPLQVASTNPVVLARDVHGNALGGIRTPQVDAPLATINADNMGAGFCRLFGSTTPFTAGEIAALYPTHEAFVNAWAVSIYANLFRGFLLPEDAPELYNAAARSTIGNPV